MTNHLIQLSKKGGLEQKIIEAKNNKSTSIVLSLLIRLFRGKGIIDDQKIRNIYENVRADEEYCLKCRKSYKSYTDKFECKYCEKFFCTKHRIPENHNCWGKVTSPHGGAFREIHTTRGGIIALGKK